LIKFIRSVGSQKWNSNKEGLKMVNLDLKDRKILYHLDLNCRQSNAQIGKKVGLSKQVVDYRIKRMEKEGIITGYWTDIDSFKLGFNIFRIYITYQNATSEKKNKIIDYFKNYNNIYIVSSIKGPIDLCIVIWVKNAYEFWIFWNKTLDLYEEYFEKATVSLYIQLRVFKKSYIVNNIVESADRELYRVNCNVFPVKIDDTDYKILDELVLNARIPLISLAEKIGCSSQNIKYKIDNLKRKGIILSFKVGIDLSKLNLRYYKMDIYLKEHKSRNKIIDYISKQSYLHELNEAIGWADIEPEIVVKNVDEVIDIMDDLDLKFPGEIKKQFHWINFKQYICKTLPEMTKNDFKG
jgi:Lrp/AsnC family leucine-responsive transcriptional regulator